MNYQKIRTAFVNYLRQSFPEYLDATFYKVCICEYSEVSTSINADSPVRFFTVSKDNNDELIPLSYTFPIGAERFIRGFEILKESNELFRIPDYTIFYYVRELENKGLFDRKYTNRGYDKLEEKSNLSYIQKLVEYSLEEWNRLLIEIKNTDVEFINPYECNTKYFVPMMCDKKIIEKFDYDETISFEDNFGRLIAKDVKETFCTIKPVYYDYQESFKKYSKKAFQNIWLDI